MAPTADQVRAALNDVDYPVSKDDLVAHVERTGAPEDVVRSVRALPLAIYDNDSQVLRSLPLEGGS